MATELTAFLPEELTGGFFRDVIIGRVKDYFREQWEAIGKAIDSGNLDPLEPIIEQISEIISASVGGRISAKAIGVAIMANGDCWEEWVASGKIRVGATESIPVRAAVIHNDLGAYLEDVAAILFPTTAALDVPPNPEFGFMEAIAIIGFAVNLFRLWRERRDKKNA